MSPPTKPGQYVTPWDSGDVIYIAPSTDSSPSLSLHALVSENNCVGSNTPAGK